MVMHQLRSDIV